MIRGLLAEGLTTPEMLLGIDVDAAPAAAPEVDSEFVPDWVAKLPLN